MKRLIVMMTASTAMMLAAGKQKMGSDEKCATGCAKMGAKYATGTLDEKTGTIAVDSMAAAK